MKKQNQKEVAQENGKLQAEIQQLKAEFADAQRKLNTASQQPCCSATICE
jgi:hypothetical protein